MNAHVFMVSFESALLRMDGFIFEGKIVLMLLLLHRGAHVVMFHTLLQK